MANYKALRVSRKEDDCFHQEIKVVDTADLPANDVLVRVKYSSLNYKDALSSTGHKGVTETYPHTPGIDAVGIVESSDAAEFKVGDEVIVTGYDLGVSTPGGFGQYIRVPAGWVVKKPQNLTFIETMSLGTAGFTAALSIEKLLAMGLTPDQGEILVTGATGGVGIVGVSLLSQMGFDVVASTSKTDLAEMLSRLGVKQIVDRDFLVENKQRALLKERWAGVLDTIGGEPLFTSIKSLKYGGSVTTCGLVAGPSFDATVYPFILRGVNLLGIDSVELPIARKQAMWDKLANEWYLDNMESFSNVISLEELPSAIDRILRGKMLGRAVICLD